MISPKLRQAGMVVNHKRVDRLYAEAGLQVRWIRRRGQSLSETAYTCFTLTLNTSYVALDHR